jgi:hypothetical protein
LSSKGRSWESGGKLTVGVQQRMGRLETLEEMEVGKGYRPHTRVERWIHFPTMVKREDSYLEKHWGEGEVN